MRTALVVVLCGLSLAASLFLLLFLGGTGNVALIGVLLTLVTVRLAGHTICSDSRRGHVYRDHCAGAGDEERPAAAGSKAPAAVAAAADDAAALLLPPTPRPPRLHWLDNLKSVLTAIVVLHHCGNAFDGSNWFFSIAGYRNSFQIFVTTQGLLDQSYFMCLFFFISGYFTPGSYDRKGRGAFLADKLKRLGLPFLCFTLVLGPGLDGLITQVLLRGRMADAGGIEPYSYNITAGPTWFLGWLLLFNMVYDLIDEPPRKVARPGLARLLVLGLGLGAVQMGCSSCGDNLAFMPLTIGSLPFDVAFFIGGVLAKRNGWLDAQLPLLPAGCATVLLSAGTAAAMTMTWIDDAGVGRLFFPVVTVVNGSVVSAEAAELAPAEAAGVLSGLYLGSGLVTMSASYAMLALFQRAFNFTSRVTRFFSQAAYAVYLIHPLVVVPVTFSYVVILEAWKGVALVFGAGQVVVHASGTDFGGDSRVWLGWGYTAVLSQLITWPLAYKLRQLPGLNRIM